MAPPAGLRELMMGPGSSSAHSSAMLEIFETFGTFAGDLEVSFFFFLSFFFFFLDFTTDIGHQLELLQLPSENVLRV